MPSRKNRMYHVDCPEHDGQPQAYAHLKMDGHFVRITRSKFGAIEAVTSQGSDCTDDVMPILNARGATLRLDCDGTYYGELYVEGGQATDVNKIELAHLRKLAMFAVYHYPHNAPLELIADHLTWCGLSCPPFRRLLNGWSVSALLQEARDTDAEGWVLKDGNLLNWHKIKPTRTIDLIVCGYIPGNGKNRGLVGSINVCTAEGRVVASVSGMSDEMRWTISHNRAEWLGRVIEVEYQNVATLGRLRFPRFKRERPDKSHAECSVSQDPKLQRVLAIVDREIVTDDDEEPE